MRAVTSCGGSIDPGKLGQACAVAEAKAALCMNSQRACGGCGTMGISKRATMVFSRLGLWLEVNRLL